MFRGLIERGKAIATAQVEATEATLKKVQDEATQKDLEVKQYTNVKSKCLTCENAFWQQYIDNPHKPDPLVLVCKKIEEISRGTQYFYGHYKRPECHEDSWSRKVLNCSDYKEVEC